MKTRIFTTALMVLLTTGLFANTTDNEKKDSTTLLAYAPAGKISHEYIPANVENPAAIYSILHAGILENWINSRELWEQRSPETESMNVSFENAGLDEWVAGREAWEQESDPAIAGMEKASLEEWISDMETWEQEGNPSEPSTFRYQSDYLETWISERNNWEQK